MLDRDIAAYTSSPRRRLIICGSMAFFGEMCAIQEAFDRQGVPGLLPNVEDERVAAFSPEQYLAFKREVSNAHLRRIQNPLTFGILVVNHDRHGIPDYIGPSTFAEIAVAAVSRKRVFVLNGYPDVYSGKLATWRACALDGRLEPLVDQYRAACSATNPQLSMFATA